MAGNFPAMFVTMARRLGLVWRDRSGDVVTQYREAFRGRELVLRDLAVFCDYGTIGVPGADLERVEGRREMFRHIMAMRGIDPLHVVQFLEGEMEYND